MVLITISKQLIFRKNAAIAGVYAPEPFNDNQVEIYTLHKSELKQVYIMLKTLAIVPHPRPLNNKLTTFIANFQLNF